MPDTNVTPLLREAINHQNSAALASRIKSAGLSSIVAVLIAT